MRRTFQFVSFPSVLIASLVLLSTSSCRSGGRQVSVSGAPIRVSAADANGAEPAIAAAANGSFFVAWVNHGPARDADVMVAHFSPEGAIQGSAVRVNSQPGVATAWRGDPPTIAIAPDQTVFVGWTGRVQPDSGHATDIYLSASRDQGRTFSQPVKVNDDQKSGPHGMHSLAVAGDGRIYVAWLDERNIAPMATMDPKMSEGTSGRHMESNREVFIASSADGGRTFSPNKKVATNVCPCCKTALAVSAEGRLYVSWRQVLPGDFRHIAVASSTDQGETFTAPKIVSDDQWMIAGCPVSGPAISTFSNGVLRVLWYSEGKNGETGLYSSESKNGGINFGPRALMAKGNIRGTPVLISDDKGLTAVWEGSGREIMKSSLNHTATGPSQFAAIATGELPAAVQTSAKLIAAYVAKTEDHQAVWIVLSSF